VRADDRIDCYLIERVLGQGSMSVVFPGPTPCVVSDR
jgi:hypothetical protein